MQYARLGDGSSQVSRFCLGLENLYVHRVIGEEEAISILDEALNLGINFFNIGGASLQQLIGNWLSQDKRRREKVVLATFARNETTEPDLSPYSNLKIRQSCEKSLRRLNTDYIDLIQFDHKCDTPWDEIWQASEQLVRNGKVINVGSANFAAWQIVQGNEAANRRGFKGFVSEQSVYNLLQRTIELEVIPACDSYGMGILPWSPMCSGLLAGNSPSHLTGRRSADLIYHELYERHREKLEAYGQLCQERGYSQAAVSLAWLLRNPVVTAPIVGPRTVEQLKQLAKAAEMSLRRELLDKLDAVFPGVGVGGPAPEAYAW